MKRKACTICFYLLLHIIFLNDNSFAQVIKWSTYLNTAGDDQLLGMVKDNNGDIYILGLTNANGFPVTPGAAQTSLIPNSFKTTISKMSGSTGDLIWSTYLGGDNDNIVVAGFVWDSVSNTINIAASAYADNYPVVNGNAKVPGSIASAVLTQLDPATGNIIYSTHTFSDKLPIYGVSSVVNGTNTILYRSVFKIFFAKGYCYFMSLDSTHKRILLSKTNLSSRQIDYQKNITVNNGIFLPSINFSATLDYAAYYLGILVDSNEVFITGTTNANDYPTTPGSYQSTYPTGGSSAYFITKLNSSGDIAFSTFANYNPERSFLPYPKIAANNNEVAFYDAVGAGIPVSAGGFGFNTATVANNGMLKLNRANGALNYFTYAGPSSAYVHLSQIQYAGNGDLIISGFSSSPFLPTTPNAIQPYESYHNPSGYDGSDCYFMHFNNQDKLVYCTYLGGEGFEGFLGASITGDNVYIPVHTSSNNFPVTGNATQPVNKGTNGAPSIIRLITGEFALVKYNIPGRKITYSSFIGSNINDQLSVSPFYDGDIAYVPLMATHYNGKPLLKDFPVSPDAFQRTMTGQNNTNEIANHQYLAKINTITGKLIYGSYIGSLPISKGEFCKALIVDGDNIFLAGQSRSNDYPVTQGAVRTTYLDTSDIFVTKLSLCHTGIINDSISPSSISVCANSLVPIITGSVPEIINPSTILRNNIPQPVSGISNFNYQWQQSNNGIVWSNISGATNKDFQPGPITSTTYFRRIASAPACENFDTSNVTVISLNGFVATRPDAGADDGTYFACPSGNLQIGTAAVPGFSYSWQPSVNLSNSNNSQTTFNSPVAGVYTYELIAIDNNGCTSKDTAVIFNYKANAGSDKVLCNNNAVLIGGLPLSGIAGVSYGWQPAAGLSCTNCAQPLVNTTGAYSLTVNVPLPQGGNCITTDSVIINSTSIPLQPAGNDTTVCFAQSVVLGTPRVPGFTYNWTPGNFMNAIADTAQPTFNKSKSTLDLLYNPALYILTANNPAGCTIVDTVKVYVNYPYAGLNACRPMQLGKEDNTNGQATYEWLLADGSQVPPGEISNTNIANPIALYNATVPNRTYLLKKTWNGLSCTNTVQVFNNCTCPSVQIKFRSPTGCPSVSNDSLEMYITNASPDFIYTWSPSTGLSSNTGTIVKSGVRTPTQYTVTATSIFDTSFYCGGGEILVNNPDTTSPVFNVHDTVVCKGQSVNIGQPEITGLRYEWTNSASNNTVVATSSNPAVVGDKDIIYYADVSEPISGCHTYDTVHIRVPQVIADAGPSRSSCSGGGFKLGTLGIPGFVYSWLPVTGLDNANTAQPVVISNAENITYTLTVQEPWSGCAATDNVTITHVNDPVLAALPVPAPYCEGSNTLVQIGPAPLDSVVYSWSPSTGLSDPNVAQPFANPGVTTTYTLTAQFPGACASSASAAVTVTVKPKPSISVSAVSNCDNTQLLATSNAVRPSYAWTPALALSNPSIPNPVSATSVPVTYTATVTDLTTNCRNAASYDVVPPVIANAGDDVEICEGNSATIGFPTDTAATYSWSPQTGLTSYTTAQTTTLNTLPAGTYIYYLTVTVNGCSKTDSVRVKVNALPIVTQVSGITICNGAFVQIGTTAEPATIYSWSPAAGLNDPYTSNPVASPHQTTVYTLTAINTLTGCTASSSVTVIVNTQNAPVVTITKSCSNALCPGDSVKLTANISGAGSYTYLWSPVTSIVTSATIRNPVVAPIETTTYTVAVTNCSSGCITTAQTTVEVKDTCNIIYPLLPVKWLSFTVVLKNDKAVLNWKVSMEQNNTAFVVERSGDGINWHQILMVPGLGDISSTRNYDATDDNPLHGLNFYRIKQFDKDGRESVSMVRSIVFGKNMPGFVVYPNPVNSGILNYTLLNAGNNSKLHLQLFDADGRLVKTIFTITGSGYFSVTELSSGIYILRMTDSNDNVVNKKLLIQQ